MANEIKQVRINSTTYDIRDNRTAFPPSTHTHDDRYYTESEMDTKLSDKQDKLTAQTAYSAKGSATKVPQITTNSLGQVTGISEVTITQPTVNNGTLTMQVEGTQKATFTANQSGNSTFNVTAADLGLSSAMKFIGTTTSAISDGSTTNPVTIDGKSVTAQNGNVVLYNSKEFLWNGSLSTPAWEELGDESSHALKSVTITGTGALGGGGSLEANRTITHNAGNAASKSSGLYKFSTDAYSHVNAVTAVTKSDITALGIPGSDTNTHRPIQMNDTQILGDNTTALNLKAGSNVTLTNSGGTVTISATDTTYSDVTTSAHGLMTAADKTKLNGIAAGAEVNQNAFSNVIVGSTTVAADSKTDSLTLVAGSNVTITPDATNDKITIAATDTNTTYSAGTGLSLSGTTFNHSNSVTAGTVSDGGSARTLGWGGTFKIPSVTYDAQGHITGTATTQITMPGNPNTDTTVTSVANHYTPSGGTATTPTSSGTATRGSTVVMTGITKDAAGHITGVTGYTLPASDNTDTKNTAGATDTSSKIYFVGATAQGANPQTYSDNEVYTTSGALTTKSVSIGGGACTLQYADEAVKFVFA